MTQTDIGFDTVKKLWFIQSFTDNRQFLGLQLIQDANLKLDKVLCDSYAWGANAQAGESVTMSHGRLRFSEGKIDIDRTDAIAKAVTIKGENPVIQFMEMTPKKIIIQFNLPSMDWTLEMDGNKYITMNLVGILTGGLMKDKLRFIIESPKSVLYSNAITIINSNLQIRPKPSNISGRCLSGPPS